MRLYVPNAAERTVPGVHLILIYACVRGESVLLPGRSYRAYTWRCIYRFALTALYPFIIF